MILNNNDVYLLFTCEISKYLLVIFVYFFYHATIIVIIISFLSKTFFNILQFILASSHLSFSNVRKIIDNVLKHLLKNTKNLNLV